MNSRELIPQELNGHISIGVYLNMECDVSHELKKKALKFSLFIAETHCECISQSSRLYKKKSKYACISLCFFFFLFPKLLNSKHTSFMPQDLECFYLFLFELEVQDTETAY